MGKIIEGTITDAIGEEVGSLTIVGHVVDVGSSRLLLVIIGFNNDDLENITDVVWDVAGVNEALTFLASEVDSNDSRTEFWYLKDPTEKTADIEITISATLSPDAGIAATAISLVGVDQGASTFNTVATNNGNSGDPTLTVVTVPGERVYGSMCCEGNDDDEIAVDAPSVEINEAQGGGGGKQACTSVANRTEVSPSVVLDWTIDNPDSWACVGVSLRAAPKAVLNPLHGFLGPPYI
jgi:hypothetical protein